MTTLAKREQFAAAAMQGTLANDGGSPASIADYAVACADALIVELQRTDPEQTAEESSTVQPQRIEVTDEACQRLEEVCRPNGMSRFPDWKAVLDYILNGERDE